nr:hypothetical protein [Tanacetum cinerariifolium]
MLDVTSGDARSYYMINEDAKSWVYLHIFTVILHNCLLFEILAQQLGLRMRQSMIIKSMMFVGPIRQAVVYHDQNL